MANDRTCGQDVVCMMRTLLAFFTLLCAATLSSEAVAQQRPRLVVLCSVDQLATWVHALGEPFYAEDGGFRRLQKSGVTFANCAYEHACTETGPGHATISTGAPASLHGIVKNNWWDRDLKKLIYCVGEPALALPDLPEGRNRGPGRLLVPTLATSMKAHIPGCKVASVSWKDRSAILMAGCDSDVTAWFEVTTGNLVTNRKWVEQTPAWLTQFNRTRAIDSFFGSSWDRTGPASAYEGLVDDRPWENLHYNGSRQRTLPQAMTGGGTEIAAPYYTQVYASPFGNTIVRMAAEAAVLGMKLGKDAATDLLCISFSATDVVGHYWGPHSVEARDALMRLDRDLGTLFRFLDAQVGAGQWSMFLTADHGVAPSPESSLLNGGSGGRGPVDTWVKSSVESALRQEFGLPTSGKFYVERVSENAVYLNGKAIATKRAAALRTATMACKRVRAVMSAYTTEEVRGDFNHTDPFRRALAHALSSQRAGDLQFILQPYWLNGATPASHGSPHSYDREVVAMAIGPGIPSGVQVATPITPGFGVVLLAKMLHIPKPSAAHESVPAGFFGLR
ncbi:MAG: putative AlkP superfamily pyrophosphatase or phosphodiesterase [Planctomycetota bacterium]|jgi:predicted AlkP superfamily pyrophosphatase or phosphodiesterase